jgi:hypothetical protein
MFYNSQREEGGLRQHVPVGDWLLLNLQSDASLNFGACTRFFVVKEGLGKRGIAYTFFLTNSEFPPGCRCLF